MGQYNKSGMLSAHAEDARAFVQCTCVPGAINSSPGLADTAALLLIIIGLHILHAQCVCSGSFLFPLHLYENHTSKSRIRHAVCSWEGKSPRACFLSIR